MVQSKVYITDFKTDVGVPILEKFKKLLRTAGLPEIEFERKFVAIKIHFGEPGNLAYLRPNYAKVVADLVREAGGRPFLTDCNTLYIGRRKEALEHLDAAYENGFSPFSTGCHVLIADGLRGTDDVAVPVKGEYIKEAYIGRAIMDADVVISLSHFKGHENMGIGGAVKNLGMGCGSRRGKMAMHADTHPVVIPEACRGCGACGAVCAHEAIAYGENRKTAIDPARCVGCGRCIGVCRFDAIESLFDSAAELLCKKTAEYALAVCQGRPTFHISLIMDVSPCCDCHAENDMPIVRDIGMLASFDPVALDCACCDLVNAEPPIPGSELDRTPGTGDHFTRLFPHTDWRVCMEQAEKIGLGKMGYELIRI